MPTIALTVTLDLAPPTHSPDATAGRMVQCAALVEELNWQLLTAVAGGYAVTGYRLQNDLAPPAGETVRKAASSPEMILWANPDSVE